MTGKKRPAATNVSDDAASSTKKKRETVRKNYVVEEDEPEDIEAEAGIIEKLCLRNFMCHSNLEFVFGPHVNFIIGRNGSGKSAVLSAIMLCLGGKSSITGRNSSMKGFIQEGKQYSDMSIVLRNRGPDAYHPDVYGDKIIVERRLYIEGHSSYKVKDISGKLISSKKDELQNVLDVLNIQVDNPVAILTQDASRSFLDSKNAKKKYELFYKATQLEKIHAHYWASQRAYHDSVETLTRKKETIPDCERELRRIQQQVRKFDMLDKQKEKRIELENELVWALIKEKEELAEKYEQHKDESKEILDKSKENHEALTKELEELHDNRRKLNHQKTKNRDEMTKLKNELDACKNKEIDIVEQTKTMKMKTLETNRKREQEEQEVNNLWKAMSDARQRMQQDNEAERREREQRVFDLTKRNQDLDAELHSCQTQVEQLREGIKEEKEAHSNTNREITYIKHEVQSRQQEVDNMRRTNSSIATLYHPRMPELLKSIQENRAKFKHVPLGPIGIHISLRDQKWALAVETCIGNLLRSFCCDNAGDRQELLKLMKRVFVSNDKLPNIIVSKFLPTVHDVSQFKVAAGNSDRYFPMFDIICCNAPPLMNCLIDQANIENMLLFLDAQEANSMMSKRPPRNSKGAFVLNGDKMFVGRTFRFYGCRNSRIQFLKGSWSKDEIDEKIREVQGLQKRVMDLEGQNRTRYLAIQSNEQECKWIQDNWLKLQKEQYSVTEELKELNESNDTCELDTLQEDLEKHTRWKNEMVALYDKQKSDLKVLCTMGKEIHEQREKKAQSLHEFKKDYDKIARDLEGCECQLSEADTAIPAMAKTIKANEDRLKNFTDLWNEASDLAKKQAHDALVLCPRVNTDRRGEMIKNDLTQLEIALKEQMGNVDIDLLKRSFMDKQEQFKKAKREIREMDGRHANLEKTLETRWKRFEMIRSDKALKVQYAFQENMYSRNFEGLLDFDHEKQTLNINANPRRSKKNELHQTSVLSGGEKSFLTVSLLLALYGTTEMPFHILDEYDVFMDSLNKDVSMRIMMEMAECQKRNQFIFLSPLDLPSTIDKNKVQIHKMRDPVRTAGQKHMDSNSNPMDGE